MSKTGENKGESRTPQAEATYDLGFDPSRYDVDVDAGLVDGEHVGIATAILGALIKHEEWLSLHPEERPQVLTAEYIEAQTKFRLTATFTGFAVENGNVSPELHEERERLTERFGEDNVLPSFFTDKTGAVQLGLFIRRPQAEDES